MCQNVHTKSYKIKKSTIPFIFIGLNCVNEGINNISSPKSDFYLIIMTLHEVFIPFSDGNKLKKSVLAILEDPKSKMHGDSAAIK